MPIIAKDNSNATYTPAPEGMHNAVCIDVHDLGWEETPWGDKHKVLVVWAIDEPHPEFDGKFRVNRKYTLSLNEKANLCQDLESWRGRAFTKEEKEGFDLEKLIGVPAMVNIVHNVDAKDRTWANVKSVNPLPKNMEPLTPPADYVRLKDRTDNDKPQAPAGRKATDNGRGNDTFSDSFASAADGDHLPF